MNPINWYYIAGQVIKYEEYTVSYLKKDCLHRIASSANILSVEELYQISRVTITKAQENRILKWIEDNREQIDQAIAEREQLQQAAEMESIV